MTPKKYKVKTMLQLYDVVNVGNVENVITGLSQCLREYAKLIEQCRMSVDCGKRKNRQILKLGDFTYIDDGKQENKFEILIHTKE